MHFNMLNVEVEKVHAMIQVWGFAEKVKLKKKTKWGVEDRGPGWTSTKAVWEERICARWRELERFNPEKDKAKLSLIILAAQWKI